MSRRVYCRPVGRVRRLNCLVACLSLLISGRADAVYVRWSCPPHLVCRTRRGRFIEFRWWPPYQREKSLLWWLSYFGRFEVRHPRFLKVFKRVW